MTLVYTKSYWEVLQNGLNWHSYCLSQAPSLTVNFIFKIFEYQRFSPHWSVVRKQGRNSRAPSPSCFARVWWVCCTLWTDLAPISPHLRSRDLKNNLMINTPNSIPKKQLKKSNKTDHVAELITAYQRRKQQKWGENAQAANKNTFLDKFQMSHP